jgi:hypothetical protein
MKSSIVQDPPSYVEIMKNYNPANNTSVNFLTIYEKSSIISMRLEQLYYSAPPYLPKDEVDALRSKFTQTNLFFREVANEELKRRLIPFLICRTFPNGTVEYWRLEDLLII